VSFPYQSRFTVLSQTESHIVSYSYCSSIQNITTKDSDYHQPSELSLAIDDSRWRNVISISPGFYFEAGGGKYFFYLFLVVMLIASIVVCLLRARFHIPGTNLLQIFRFDDKARFSHVGRLFYRLLIRSLHHRFLHGIRYHLDIEAYKSREYMG
jgi:hypothetical protein